MDRRGVVAIVVTSIATVSFSEGRDVNRLKVGLPIFLRTNEIIKTFAI